MRLGGEDRPEATAHSVLASIRSCLWGLILCFAKSQVRPAVTRRRQASEQGPAGPHGSALMPRAQRQGHRLAAGLSLKTTFRRDGHRRQRDRGNSARDTTGQLVAKQTGLLPGNAPLGGPSRHPGDLRRVRRSCCVGNRDAGRDVGIFPVQGISNPFTGEEKAPGSCCTWEAVTGHVRLQQSPCGWPSVQTWAQLPGWTGTPPTDLAPCTQGSRRPEGNVQWTRASCSVARPLLISG